MNLNYEEFKEKIKEDIKDYMDEKYKDCGSQTLWLYFTIVI